MSYPIYFVIGMTCSWSIVGQVSKGQSPSFEATPWYPVYSNKSPAGLQVVQVVSHHRGTIYLHRDSSWSSCKMVGGPEHCLAWDELWFLPSPSHWVTQSPTHRGTGKPPCIAQGNMLLYSPSDQGLWSIAQASQPTKSPFNFSFFHWEDPDVFWNAILQSRLCGYLLLDYGPSE